MRTRILAATTVATAVISGIAFAQTPKAEEDHSAHHPAGSTAAANSSTPSAAPSPEAINQQMKAMQAEIQKLSEENAALKADKSDKIMDIQADYALGQQELAQTGELKVMEMQFDQQADIYKAGVNAAAQASRPVTQGSKAR